MTGTVVLVAALLLVLAVVAVLGLLRRQAEGQLAAVEGQLARQTARGRFDPASVAGLPPPARRFLCHAIREGAPLAGHVRLRQAARMKPGPDKPHLALDCREVLAPGVGLVWRARGRMGLPVAVTDHYLRDDGSVRVALLGLVPVVNARGPDIARSARGRVAAEALWCPPALVQRDHVRWEAVDDERVRLVQRIDGEELSQELRVDGEGRLRELRMERWGDQGRPDFGMIPYGFEVLDEATFGDYTVASRLRGGWWYGTGRYRPEDASEFTVVEAAWG